jgi:predicted anti-sigma-YlaC factor YlaD
MSDHENIRELLALAGAGALSRVEEEQVAAHLRSCKVCSTEMNSWQSIVGDLRGLPTPQPSPGLLQITIARAEAKLAEQEEHDWNRRVMIFVVAFAWLLTVVSWLSFRLVSGSLLSFFVPQLNRTWTNFAEFTALVWIAGGAAAVALALRQRRERRLA